MKKNIEYIKTLILELGREKAKEEVLKKLECRKTDNEFESYIYLLKSKDFEIEFWVDMEYFK